MKSLESIVTNRADWEQYVDPDNNEPKAFDAPLKKRIKTVVDLWPDELTDADRAYANAHGVRVRSVAVQETNRDAGNRYGVPALAKHRSSKK